MSWWVLWHNATLGNVWQSLMMLYVHLGRWYLSSIYLWRAHHLFVDLKPHNTQSGEHFHLPEIQQGTKYLWCFNPTCQCAGAFAFICSALLRYTPHIWRPSITKSQWLHTRSPPPQPPRMFKLLQEPELLDLFIQLPRLRRDTQCLQPWPATRWLLWLVCINKKRKIISTNSFIKLTGHKTERD